MISSQALCDFARRVHQAGTGYIWGKRGQTWTQAQQDAAARAQTRRFGQQWVGRRVTDCSGLFVWAFAELGGSIYHGSNTIWARHCAAQGKLIAGRRADGYALRPGTAMFLLDATGRHHIGCYVGDGVVIEAKSTQYGVVTSAPSHWDEWGELADVDYTMYLPTKEGDRLYPTLKKGDAGVDVKALQALLNQHGYALKMDGKFGTNTEQAVKLYQQAQGLTPDGVAGPKTWAALTAAQAPAQPQPQPDIQPQIDAVYAALDALKEAVYGLEERIGFITEGKGGD